MKIHKLIYAIAIILVLLLLLLSPAVAGDMQTHYWPDREPEGHPPVFDWVPYTQTPDIPKWCQENWGEKKTGHCLMVRLTDYQEDGRWRQERTKHLICDGSGKVNEASIGQTIKRGRLFEPLADQFEKICEQIDRAGYEVVIVACDIEFKLTSGYCWYGDDGIPGGHDIPIGLALHHLHNTGQARGLPKLNYSLLIAPDQYKHGNEHIYTTRRIYDEWQLRRNAKSIDRVFGRIARETWGSDTICCNYDMCSFNGARPRAAAQYLPNAPVGKYSAPAIYVGHGYYPTREAALVALDCVTDPPERVIPWVERPATSEHFDFLSDQIQQRGHRHLLVW